MKYRKRDTITSSKNSMVPLVQHMLTLLDQHKDLKDSPLLFVRQAAKKYFEAYEWPTRYDAHYRDSFIPLLGRITPLPFLSGMGDIVPELLNSEEKNTLHRINGVVQKNRLFFEEQNSVYIGSLLEAPDSLVEYVMEGFQTLIGLNSSELMLGLLLLRDVTFIYVPSGVRIREPIVLNSRVVSKKSGVASSHMTCVIIEENAHIKLHMNHSSDVEDVLQLHNTYLHVGKHASVTLHSVGITTDSQVFLEQQYVRMNEQSSVYSSHVLAGSGKMSYRETVEAVKATDYHSGIGHILAGSGLGETHTFLRHSGENAKSALAVRSIVDDVAKSSFSTGVHIPPQTPGIDAKQQIKGLKLSPKSFISAVPQLEIETDDVLCSHGVAIGKVDPGLVAYLRSRGLSQRHIIHILTEGFLSDVTGGTVLPALEEAVKSILLTKRP